MYERQIYRPCPMCRAQLEETVMEGVTDAGWKYYECKNCGSAVYIRPFIRVKEGKLE